MLPATKSQPKEMMTIVDKPAIHYVVEEAIKSGIDDILLITGRGKRALEDYFDNSPELEIFLKSRGKYECVEKLNTAFNLIKNASIHYIRQREPVGLGDAVYHAKKYVGNNWFSVLLGDDIIVSEKPAITQLIEIHEMTGASVILVEKVSMNEVSKYGVIECDMIEKATDKSVYNVRRIVEKPSPENAPSNLAVAGRYILSPSIFKILENVVPGRDGEKHLTDALDVLAREGKVVAKLLEGKRYDVGSISGWLRANIEISLMRDDYRNNVIEIIRKVMI